MQQAHQGGVAALVIDRCPKSGVRYDRPGSLHPEDVGGPWGEPRASISPIRTTERLRWIAGHFDPSVDAETLAQAVHSPRPESGRTAISPQPQLFHVPSPMDTMRPAYLAILLATTAIGIERLKHDLDAEPEQQGQRGE